MMDTLYGYLLMERIELYMLTHILLWMLLIVSLVLQHKNRVYYAF